MVNCIFKHPFSQYPSLLIYKNVSHNVNESKQILQAILYDILWVYLHIDGHITGGRVSL